jgi:UDP-2,3-diacylglucosamine pyrophosphatase LpxH
VGAGAHAACYGGVVSIRHAVVFSDVHLGWAVCSRHHARWLDRLPEAVDDAELVVLNGDVVDGYRGVHGRTGHELLDRLAALAVGWRREGRAVVYVEGNHDSALPATMPLRPDRWLHDFETDAGERVRVLHGHRFASQTFRPAAYERAGRRLLSLENRVYDRIASLRRLYRFGPAWLTSAIGSTECRIERGRLPGQLAPLLDGVDVLVHGHIHFGPGTTRIRGRSCWRSGAWVSAGQPRAADRMLRYRRRRFERIGWDGRAWRAFDDGR